MGKGCSCGFFPDLGIWQTNPAMNPDLGGQDVGGNEKLHSLEKCYKMPPTKIIEQATPGFIQANE